MDHHEEEPAACHSGNSTNHNSGDPYLSGLDPNDGFFRPEAEDIICGMFHGGFSSIVIYFFATKYRSYYLKDNCESVRLTFPVLLTSPRLCNTIGRGKSIAHKGNAKFRNLINLRKDEYQAARRREDKTRLTIEIVQELRKTSRFLLKDPKLQLWFEVGEEYMKEKVSHALRSRPNEERRKRPKPSKKKALRKKHLSPAIDDAVESLIQEQQALLKSMIEREGGGSSAGTSSSGDE